MIKFGTLHSFSKIFNCIAQGLFMPSASKGVGVECAVNNGVLTALFFQLKQVEIRGAVYTLLQPISAACLHVL